MKSLFKHVQVGVLGASLCATILALGACGGGSGDDGGGANDGGGTVCATGDEGCACWPNETCNDASLSCYSMLCVAAGAGTGGAVSPGSGGEGGAPGYGGAPVPSGTGGAVVSPGTGGASVPAGSGGASVPAGTGGAVVSPGTGGASVPAGSGGASVPAGTGGAVVLPGTGGASVPAGSGGASVPAGSGGAPSAGGTSGGGGSVSDGCNNASASTLDNFATCDTSICNLAGRSGTWFSYSSNTNIGIQCSAQVPPISWIDRSCAYYCTNGVAGATWAGAGFDLKDPSGAYDLSSYTGIYVRVETGQALTVAMTDLAGGTWRSPSIGGDSGAVTYTLPFSKMSPDSGTSGSPNLSQIVGFRFDVDAEVLSSFGFAIHMVSLY